MPQSQRLQLNPDSAVAIDGKHEARSFRNKVDGFVPLSSHRSAVLRRAAELHRNDLTSQNDVETSESDAFAAPGLHLVPSGCRLTAESGLNSEFAENFKWDSVADPSKA